MAEQALDVVVTEKGTAVVRSELSKLDADLAKVAKAQASNASATEKAVKATESAAKSTKELTKSVTAYLEAQGKRLKIIDASVGLVGKLTGGLGLLAIALKGIQALYKAINPPAKDWTKQLEKQVLLVRKLSTEIGKIQAGPARVAAAAGRDISAITIAGQQDIQQREAQLIRAREDAKRISEDALAAAERLKRPLQQQFDLLGNRIVDPMAQQLRELDKALVETADNRLADINATIRRLEAADKALIESLKAESAAKPDAPTGAARDAALDKRIRSALADDIDIDAVLAGQADFGTILADEDTSAPLDIEAQIDRLFGPDRVIETIALADGMAAVVEQIRAVEEAYKMGADAALDFAEAQGKQAAGAAIAAIINGENVAAVLEQSMQAIAIQAGVESLFELAKGYAAAGTPGGQASATYHFAAAKTFGIVAGAATVASVTAGAIAGGGGGGGPGVGAPTSQDFGGRARDDATQGGSREVTIYIEGMSLGTAADISSAIMDGLEYASDTPGMAHRVQAITSGRRR